MTPLHMRYSEKLKIIKTENRMMVNRAWGRGRWGALFNGYRFSFTKQKELWR